MREVNKLNAKYTLFIGGDEYKNGMINLKNMETGEQTNLPINDLSRVIDNLKA